MKGKTGEDQVSITRIISYRSTEFWVRHSLTLIQNLILKKKKTLKYITYKKLS